MTSSGLRNFILSLIAIAAVVFLAISVFIMQGKAGAAAEEAASAEEAAAAYAAALAESTARMNEAVSEKQSLEAKAEAALEAPEKADYSGEAMIYSDFIAEDGAIRSALSALSQDDPEMIKNYRIKVDLRKMETVQVNGKDGRRVRFEGRFEKPVTRKNAIIRINGVSGTYNGKIYVTNIRFDDTKYLDLSGLTDDDVASSHGSALRSVGLADINGERAVVCETGYAGNSETDNTAVQIPFGDLDSADLSTVYYDLYFEGTDSDLNFNTGCDFAGKDDISKDLDEINSDFAIYRGKEAAGQDAGEAKEKVLSSIEKMKSDLSVYSETDPLVIKINDLLDRKSAVIDGSDITEEAAVTDEGQEKPSEEKTGTKDSGGNGVSTVGGYVPSGTGKNSGSMLPAILAVLFSLTGIVMIIMLGMSSAPAEVDYEEAGIMAKEAEEAAEVKRIESERIRKITRDISEKIDVLSNEISAPGPDLSGIYAGLDEVAEKADELTGLLSEFREVSSESGKDDITRSVEKDLKGIRSSNDSLKEYLGSLALQLEETSRSVTDINKAATIISDVASETNLLSLNASIEAARAGEAGRGFAVVAGEIQKLADQTEKSASEISDTVDKLNSDFERTKKYMDTISESSDTQDKKLTESMKRFGKSGNTGSFADNRREYDKILREYENSIKELKKTAAALSSEADRIASAAESKAVNEGLIDDIRSELREI